MDFVVVEVSLELPDCLGLPGGEESILHTLSLDHVGRKSRAEPGEFERAGIEEVVGGGKCQLVLKLACSWAVNSPRVLYLLLKLYVLTAPSPSDFPQEIW